MRAGGGEGAEAIRDDGARSCGEGRVRQVHVTAEEFGHSPQCPLFQQHSGLDLDIELPMYDGPYAHGRERIQAEVGQRCVGVDVFGAVSHHSGHAQP